MNMTVSERASFQRAVDLSLASAQSPSQAATNAAQIAADLARASVGVNRATDATKLYSVDFGGSQVVVTSGVVTPIAKANFTWPEDYHVIGVKAMVVEGYTLLSHLKLSLQTQSSEPIFLTSNQGAGAGTPGYVSFANLIGPYDPSGYLPMNRYVESQKSWSYQLTSGDTTGNATYTPELIFLVELWDKSKYPQPLTTATQ